MYYSLSCDARRKRWRRGRTVLNVANFHFVTWGSCLRLLCVFLFFRRNFTKLTLQ